MLLSPLAAMLSAWADRVLRLVTGTPPAPPSFEGLLDELFSHWPLDAAEHERPEARRALPLAA